MLRATRLIITRRPRLAASCQPRCCLASHAAAPLFDMLAIRAEIAAEHAREATEVPETVPASSSTYEAPNAPWHWLDRELSSNVAGETGAVCIYDGAAAALQWRERWIGAVDPSTRSFVEEHRAAEQAHLDLFKALIPPHKHTILLPVWRVAGFTLGLLPTLAGDRALFVTVEAVETFVEEHYHEQARGFSPAAQTPKPPG